MSSTLSNIQLGTSVATLDGLSIINADQLFVDGQNVNPSAPNIPINPTSTNATYAPVFTNSFASQSSGALLVDANFGLTFNPATDTLGTTNLYTNGSIYVGGVMTGTPSYYIGVNSLNNIVKFSAPTIPVPNQINVIGNTGYSQLYPAFLTTNSSGDQNIFVDTAGNTIYYNEVTQTLVVVNLNSTTLTTTGLVTANTLKINSVPSGTINKYLAITATGEVIQAPIPSAPTQLLTTRTSTSTVYYPTFVSTNTTGDKSYFVPYPSSSGYEIYYINNTVGGVGTLYTPQLVIDSSVVLPSTATSFASTPLTTGSPIVYGLGIDANNLIKAYTVGAPNVTVTNTNATYYPVFVATTMTSGVKDLYQDTTGNDFNYNPSTNLLTVSNLTVSGTTTISGYAPLASPSFTGTPTAPTAVSGTNTTQIATTAFVQTAIGGVSGYLPLTGGTMTGSISFASGVSTLLRAYYNGFVQYTYNISDNNGNNYISYTTDAPSATPVPLVGYIVLNRTTSINGQITSSSNASFGGTTISTGKITGNAGLTITNGGVTYANIGLNGINTLNGDTSFFSTAGNAVMQVSYGSGVNQNISATASYNWQTTSGGIGTTCMNIDVNRVKVSTIELAVSSQTYGQLRMIWSETGYGTFWRNDNANLYLLITANNDPYGIWNSLRPFYINLTSGRLYSTNGQTFSNGTDTDYLTFQNGLGLTTASGATFGNVSVYGTGLNGWNGYDINKRWTLMGWSGNTEAGFIDNQVSWIWRTTGNNFHLDRPYIYFNNVPQQNYSPNQVLIGSNGNSLQWGVVYSTYYKNNNIQWQYGTVVATFYKASATAYLRASGAASYYVSSSQMNWTLVRFRNITYGGDYDYYLNQFTNNPNNHVSFPIMAQAGGLPVGSYQVILYTAGNTDGNDHLYILSEICFA